MEALLESEHFQNTPEESTGNFVERINLPRNLLKIVSSENQMEENQRGREFGNN